MRGWNLRHPEHDRVSFYGIDGSEFWNTAAGALASACDFIDRVDPRLGATIRGSLLPLAQAIRYSQIGTADPAALDSLQLGTQSVINAYVVQQIHWIADSDREAFDWAYRAAITAGQIAGILREANRDPENAARIWWNCRDAGMASLLQWAIDREGSDQKVIVGAHNVHLQKTFARESNFDQATLGQYLCAARRPRGVVMIAGTNNLSLRPGDTAAADSLQGALAHVGVAEFLLDIRKAARNPAIYTHLRQVMPDRTNLMYQPVVPAEAWDAIYFTDSVHLDRLALPESRKRQPFPLAHSDAIGVVGTYSMVGVVGMMVYLRIELESLGLFSYGEESDGELFPMHRSQLWALSRDTFFWTEWPLMLTFTRDTLGIAQSLCIEFPDCAQRYLGTRLHEHKLVPM
jgi:erythromycin esterase-like protein